MVTAVSDEEYRHHRERTIPEMTEVSPGVWALAIPYRAGHLPYTFAYLIEDAEGGVHVVDPGWDTDQNLALLTDAVQQIGRRGEGPTSVIVTHLHADHMGLAARLREAFGSPVHLHARDQAAQESYYRSATDEDTIRATLGSWAVPADRVDEMVGFAQLTIRVKVPADVVMYDGDLAQIPGRRLRVLLTPGHTPGHVCLHDEEAGLLFTGDHLLPRATPGLGDPGPFDENPLELYLDSLTTISAYDHCQCLPGHEYRYHGIAERARAIARRHLRRTVEVEAIVARGPDATVWQVASHLTWAQGWDALTRHFLIGALRQTAMHCRLVASGAHTKAFSQWGRPAPDPVEEQ